MEDKTSLKSYQKPDNHNLIIALRHNLNLHGELKLDICLSQIHNMGNKTVFFLVILNVDFNMEI